VTDKSLQETVLRRTNKALRSAGHRPIANERGLLEHFVAIFAGMFSSTDDANFPASGSEAESRAAKYAGGVTAYLEDRTLATNGLVRTAFTAERVGQLINAVEVFKVNRRYPQLSSVRLRREEMIAVEVFKHLNFELVIRSPRLAVVEHRGTEFVKHIFDALNKSEGKLLASDWQADYFAAKKQSASAAKRVVCDYVACMTDRYAAELHDRLFADGASVFKPL
jgi:dGTPase